jgi:predicted nuclease of predicted toxin-antitoxin system
VRVLIDECLPRQLKGLLAGAHETATVPDSGWAGLKNGVLLRQADACFDVLLTADQRIYHQQSFAGLRIAIIVLPTNRLRDVIDAVPALLQSLERIERGQHVTVDFGPRTERWADLRLQSIVDDGGVLRHLFG